MESALDAPTKRRSRMHRRSSGKRLALTPRDLDIFKLLRRYRYLRSNFIHAFVGGNKTKLVERLGDLYHEGGYLERPPQQWQSVNARYMPVVYEITNQAEDILLAHGALEGDARTWLSRGSRGAHRQLDHALMTCEVLASIELAAKQDVSLRFIPWAEILAKAPDATRASPAPFQLPVPNASAMPNTKGSGPLGPCLVPDAMFGLAYLDGNKKRYRFFALEVDRASEPVTRSDLGQSSYLKKLAAYRDATAREVHRSHLGLPNLLILTVTTNERHMRHIMRTLQQFSSGEDSERFLFKAARCSTAFGAPPAPMSDLLGTPWSRVGHQDFEIGKA